MKRAFDFLAAGSGLIALSPLLVPVAVLIWLQDYHSPFYRGARVGRKGKPFRMVKFRSMVVNADKTGVASTAADDRRITPIGQFVRSYKLDELTQLWNVLLGDMSLVGPRPQVQPDVNLYTEAEKKLLTVRPGITDLASIVFSDEGDILKGSPDPDLRYNQVIRPWKSRLALFYIENRTFVMDLKIIILTAQAIVSKPKALKGVQAILRSKGADPQLIEIAGRTKELQPFPPPGAAEVFSRGSLTPTPA